MPKNKPAYLTNPMDDGGYPEEAYPSHLRMTHDEVRHSTIPHVNPNRAGYDRYMELMDRVSARRTFRQENPKPKRRND